MKYLSRFLKSPGLHFLLIGALLFTVHQFWTAYSARHLPAAKEELVIGKEQIDQIKNDIRAQTGTQASPAQIETAIQKAIDDEILYRQALALHLDRNNPSIRHRLIQLARFVSEDPKTSDATHYRKALDLGLDRSDQVIKRYLISMMSLVAKKVPTPQAPSQVSTKELKDYLEQHPQSFMTPLQFKISQIYFSRDKRRAQAESQAKALLTQLQKEGIKPDQSSGLGDSFLEGNHFPWLNDSALERLFGAVFTQHLAASEAGKWVGPLPSSYGWHLVFIKGTRPPQIPPLETVANQVKSAILKEREQQRMIETLQELRSRYSIHVEDGGSNAKDQS